MDMKIKIDGGKLFVDGKELENITGDQVISGIVSGEPCVVLAGQVYLGEGKNYHFVGSISHDEFKEWRDDRKDK